MATYYKQGDTWSVAYRLRGQRRQYIYGIKTERLARQARDKKALEEQLVKADLLEVDPGAAKREAAERKGIEAVCDEFERHIVNCGRLKQHASQQSNHVRRLCRMARIASIAQLDPAKIQSAAKRLMDEDKLGPRTANAALKAARQFSTWAYAVAGYLKLDALHKKLQTFNEEVDKRRRRRAMSEEEFGQLVSSLLAGRDKNNRSGIGRLDRAMLYQVGIGTGFRQEALMSLRKSSFHVAPELTRPYVELGAAFNKNRKPRQQPIRRDLADQLRRWLEAKPDGLVWRPSPHADLALRFRRDMEAARAAWVAAAGSTKERRRREESTFLSYVYDDGRGKVWADFHGLRHTGITFVVRGAGLKEAQAWADHSTPVLTSKYAHMDLADEARSLDSLPGPVTAKPQGDLAPGPALFAERSGENQRNPEGRKARKGA